MIKDNKIWYRINFALDTEGIDMEHVFFYNATKSGLRSKVFLKLTQ